MVELNVQSVDEAHKIENSIQVFIKEKIIPEIERYFEHVSVPDVHVVMERLQLDFSQNVLYNPLWKDDLRIQLDKAFKASIEYAKSVQKGTITKEQSDHFALIAPETQVHAGEKSILQAITYFLSSGKAPWWMNTSTEQLSELLDERAIIEQLQKPDFAQRVITLMRQQPVSRKRFVLQFDDPVQLRIFEKVREAVSSTSVSTQVQTNESELLKLFSMLKKEDRDYFWFAVHTFASEPAAFNSNAKKMDLIRSIARRFGKGQTTLLHPIIEQSSQGKITKSKSQESPLPPIIALAVLLLSPEQQSSSALAQFFKAQLKKNVSPYFIVPEDRAISNNDPKAKIWFESTIFPVAKPSSEEQRSSITSSKDSSEKQNSSIDSKEEQVLPADSIPKKDQSSENKTSKDKLHPYQQHETVKKQASETPATPEEKSPFERQLDEDWEHQQSQTEKDGIYVENAGLILLHPFFAPLFQNLGYLNDKQQIIQPQRAVHLLHFIATGEEQDFEHAMQFAKYICGVPNSTVIERNIVLNDQEKHEGESVLNSSLKYWTSLKSSSKDLLRQEFLKRPGKVFTDSTVERIIIEHKTVDILLNQLPWNISMVRLPWLVEMLHIEWGK